MNKRKINNLSFKFISDGLHQIFRSLLQEDIVIAFPGDIDLDIIGTGRNSAEGGVAMSTKNGS